MPITVPVKTERLAKIAEAYGEAVKAQRQKMLNSTVGAIKDRYLTRWNKFWFPKFYKQVEALPTEISWGEFNKFIDMLHWAERAEYFFNVDYYQDIVRVQEMKAACNENLGSDTVFVAAADLKLVSRWVDLSKI